MNSSLVTADRATHFRIVMTAAFGAMLIIAIAMGSRGAITAKAAVLTQNVNAATFA